MENVPSHARRPNASGIKNKAPADLQITAEQLLREAWERKESAPAVVPKLHIANHDELQEYQKTERKNFEMRIVRNRSHTPLWIRYARWEEDQREFVRARSIWERALDTDYRNPVLWLNYAEMEMRHRFINHARNVLDRAVALLPRNDHLWLKYAHMEEMLARIDLARNVFNRWLLWFPENTAYFAFIRFELRHGQYAKARQVFEQLVAVHPTSQSYLKYAKFEERNEQYARARQVYERVTDHLMMDQVPASFFIAFAKFEERRVQVARARVIYKFALSNYSGEDATELDHAYTTFEKHHGDPNSLDNLLLEKRRMHLEQKLSSDTNYNTWFDLIRLEETSSPLERVRETYERALTQTPAIATKAAWSSYIYLWLLYATWTEVECDDINAALAIYKRCLAAVPHQHRKFSFCKLWLQYAQTEIRNGNIGAARQIFGASIGVLPGKHRLYQEYIQFECALGEMERAREIYHVWLTRHPTCEMAFIALADLEMTLGEINRAIAVMELATCVESLDSSPVVWAKLASLTVSCYGTAEAISRIEKHTLKTPTPIQAWIVYVDMIMNMEVEDTLVRQAFKRAWENIKQQVSLSRNIDSRDNELFKLLEISDRWLAWERSRNDLSTSEKKFNVEYVEKIMPHYVTNGKNKVLVLPNNDAGKNRTIGNQLLEAAHQWKKNGTMMQSI